MSCRPLKSIYLGGMENPTEILKLLNKEVDELKNMTKDVDFNNQQDCDQFIRNIQYLKSYFEKYHTLIAP